MTHDGISVESSFNDAAQTLNDSEDPLNNIVFFQKRDGTTNQGTNYEVYVTSLVALRLALDDDVQDFLIASNHPDYGAFDDIIVQVRRVGHAKRNYAVQLKHKAKQKPIGANFFTSEDFCILKYKESFLDVARSIDGENTTFCLFTNSVVEEQKLKRMRFKLREHLKKAECDLCAEFPEKHHHSASLHFTIKTSPSTAKDFLCTKGNCYDLAIHSSDDSDESDARLKDYAEFFGKFKLYAGQMSSEEVKLRITDEFTEQFGTSAQEVGEKFISFVDDWFFKKGEIGWLSKAHAKLKILELLLTPFVIEPTFTGAHLQQSSLWNAIVACANVTVVNGDAEDADCLSKIYGAIEEKMRDALHVPVNLRNWMEYVPKDVEEALKKKKLGSILNTVPEHGRINSKRLLIASWKMGLVPLVLRVSQSNRNYLTAALNTIGFNGLYVFVGKPPGGKLKPGLKVLTDMSVDKTITKTVKVLEHISRYLTKHPINFTVLEEMMAMLSDKVSKLRNAMGAGGLHTSTGGINQAMKILQTAQKRLRSLYTHVSAAQKNKTKKMKRAFRKTHAALLNIKTESRKYFGVDATHLQNRILHAAKLSPQGRRSLTVFDFCESSTKSLNKIMRRITPSLLLRLLDTTPCYCAGAKLEENAADYISRNFKWRRLITNEADLFVKFKNDINVISGDPGMGKTTTLKSLAFHCNPRYWVLLINLNEIQEDFFNAAGGVLDDPIRYLFEKLERDAGAFTSALFGHLRKSRKLLVILDSFDEVSPKYNDVVINLMKKIQKEGLRVWIATRPFAKSFIENAFSVHTIHMLGFTEQDFRNYLSLHEVSARDKDFILGNIDKHFYTVPLHAYMLTTVKNFGERFEITDVYEKFIDQKFDTFCRKHDLLQCKNNTDVLVKASKKELIKNHEVMALAVIYGVEFFKIAIAMNHEKLVKNFEEAVQTTENCKNPLGLVVGVSNQIPVFIHKSYAEYMAAKWLSKNITRASVDYTPDIYSKLNPDCAANSTTVVFRDVKLYEKLFSPGHKLVRSMFDKIAAKEKPLHLAVLNSNLDAVKTLCGKEMDLDKFGRTPLHLAVAVFDPHATFMSSGGEINRNKCEILGVLVEHFGGRTPDFLVKDAFGWDFLQYAKLSGNEDLPHVAAHHGELKSLSLFLDHLPDAQLRRTINKKNAKNMTLLNIATARGHANVVEYLIGKGADVEGRDVTGNTPFQVACKNGYLELVGFLLEAGVVKDTSNQFGNAPLHSAAKHGHFEVVRLLVEVGSDVNVCNNSRETPLHVAAANGHLHIVEFLVKGGADVIAEDVNASTPSYMAAERGHVNVVKCLIEKEAQNYKGFISQDFVDGSVEINKECRAGGDTEEYLSVLATLHALKFTLCDEDNKEVEISFNVEEYGEFGGLIVQRVRGDETSETFAMSFVRCTTEGAPLEFDFRRISHCYGHMKNALREPCSLRFCLHVDCASVSDEEELEASEDVFALTGRRCYKYAETDGREEFLSKLWFYYGPFDCATLKNSIGSLLEEAGFGRIDDDVIENVVANFRPRKKCRLVMNKELIKVKLLECLLTPLMVEPEIYVPLGMNELVWSDLINDADVTLIGDWSSENWKLVRRIFYTMQVHVRNACKINLNLKLWMQHKALHPVKRFFPCIKKLMAMLWEKRVLPLFLQINGEEEQARFLSAVLNKLPLPSSGYKCIVMADDFSRLELRSDLKVFDSLKIASDAVRMRILQETEVALQGRPSINLHKLTDGFDVDCISSTFLATMNKSNAICKSLEHRVEFYVSRRFYRTLLRAEVLWKTEGNVFVLDSELNSAMSRSCLEIGTSVINLMVRKTDVVGSILKAESTNVIVVVDASEATSLYDELKSNESLAFLKVHRLRVVDGDYLEWLRSSGGVKDLNGFLAQAQTVNERGLLKSCKNRVNVVSAVAGMGKTIALQSLAWSCEPDHFVLPVDLCEYEGKFGRDLSDDPLDYFYEKLRGDKRATLDEEVFKMCKAQKKVVVFMDGFERMLHRDKDHVLEVVEKLSEEDVQVWIATRPIGVGHLQERFNVLPINLQEINDAEKECYLHEVLYAPGSQERGVLYSRIKTSFYRIPLHLKILARNLNAEKLSVARFEWDVNWYRCFVQEKIRTFYGQWGGFEKFAATCTQLCQTLALVSVYGRNFVLSNNACHEEHLDEIVKDVLRRGKDAGFIAAIKDNVPIFTSEVYRDYFLATWLLRNIHYPICREMYRLLFQPGLNSARRMFDKFAADGCPLHLAVLSNNVSELKRISKDSNVMTKLRDRLGRTPLHLAVSHFEPLEFTAPEHKTSCAIVSLVVDFLKTAEVHSQDILLEWDWLRYATESGNLELFHLAALHGHVNVMQLFLKNHWYVNKASRSGRTALDLAMSEFHVQAVKFLLGQNRTPESVKEANYLKAAAAGRLDVMKLFLRAGVDVNCADSNGQNALHEAALNGSLKCVKYLLSGGLGVDSRTKDMQTPLHFAAANGHLRVVDLLIKMRADVNAADSDGRTSLHLAIINDKKNCTSSLLYTYANVNAKDKFGLTPLNVAISKNNQGILALLLTLRCMDVSNVLGGSIEGLFKNTPSLQSNNNDGGDDDDDSSGDDFEIAEDALIQLS